MFGLYVLMWPLTAAVCENWMMGNNACERICTASTADSAGLEKGDCASQCSCIAPRLRVASLNATHGTVSGQRARSVQTVAQYQHSETIIVTQLVRLKYVALTMETAIRVWKAMWRLRVLQATVPGTRLMLI